MKKAIIILMLTFLSSVGFSQIVITADSVKIGAVSGNGTSSIYGATHLKNITLGSQNDSLLLRDINGVIKYMPRSAFSSAVVGSAIITYLQSLAGYAPGKVLGSDLTWVDNSGGSTSGGSYTLEETVVVNFGNNFLAEIVAGRNNFLPTPAQAATQNGFSMTNLKNTSDVATDLDLAIGAPFSDAANSYGTASGNAHIYTDLAVNSGMGSTSSTTDGTLIFSGLDNSKFYHFYILAADASANSGAQWTIGSIQRTKVTTNNYPLAANGDKYTNPAIERIFNVQPVGGVITIGARKTGTHYDQSMFNVVEIERSNVAK